MICSCLNEEITNGKTKINFFLKVSFDTGWKSFKRYTIEKNWTENRKTSDENF